MWRGRSITMILFKLAPAKLHISLLQCLHAVQSVITIAPSCHFGNGTTLSQATHASSALAVDHGESLGYHLSPANEKGVQDCPRCGNKLRQREETVSGQSLQEFPTSPCFLDTAKYAPRCCWCQAWQQSMATGVSSPDPCHGVSLDHSGKSCVALGSRGERSHRTAKSLQQLRRCRHGETA